MDISPGPSSAVSEQSEAISGPSTSSSDNETSTETSTTVTPLGSSTPTGSVVVPSRDRSGTIIARPVWDAPPRNLSPTATVTRHRSHRMREQQHRERDRPSPSGSTDNSHPGTETEDDGDGDVDMDSVNHSQLSVHNDSDGIASASASPSPERHPHPHLSIGRRAVGIVSDDPGATGLQVGNMNMGGLDLDGDAHIIINEAGGVGDVGVGVEDGIVSLEPNDDFAMGAPPGAPGAIDEGTTPRGLNLNMEGVRRRNTVDAPDVTPRAGVVGLPLMGGAGAATVGGPAHQLHQAVHGHQRNTTIRGRVNPVTDINLQANATGANGAAAAAAAATASINNIGRRASNANTHHHTDTSPYRDEDVLLSLQLLAYLSKYPHVRQAFYKPRTTFHPASSNLPNARYGVGAAPAQAAGSGHREREKVNVPAPVVKENHGFFRAFANVGSSRGKEKEKAHSHHSTVVPQTSPILVAPVTPTATRQTNVFSLVERFTFKPSSTEADLPSPPPRLPPEIQYWAGVIMRNACRKDESRGGIRQCANSTCLTIIRVRTFYLILCFL